MEPLTVWQRLGAWLRRQRNRLCEHAFADDLREPVSDEWGECNGVICCTKCGQDFPCSIKLR